MRYPIFFFLLLFSSYLFAQHAPRELLYVHTDRTLYTPGDVAFLRAYLTDGALRQANAPSDVVSLQLLDPGGTVIQTHHLYRGAAGFDGYLQFGTDLKGGRYTLRAYTNCLGNFGEDALFTKHLYLQEIANPELLLQLEPERESFRPGTTVAYTLTARSRDGEPLADTDVSATLRFAGRALAAVSFRTDPVGVADLRLPLPASLTTDDVVLTASVRHEGQVETAYRPVRVALGFIDLRFFPEGGQRSNGHHKIAFRATDQHGKPLDVTGELLVNRRPVQPLRSQHNGYGHFYTPAGDYIAAEVRLDGYPDTLFTVPEPHFLAVAATLTPTDTTVLLDLAGNHGAPFFTAELARQDSVLSVTRVTNGRTAFPLAGHPPGVYRLRLTDETGRARWERLFFHRPQRVTITELEETKAGHRFALHDAAGQPVSGNFSIALVNDGQHTRQNDKQPHLVAQLLLQSQLRGTLYEPNDYFDREQPAALAALDDVLLCHGWRSYEVAAPRFQPLRTGLYGYVGRPLDFDFATGEYSTFTRSQKLRLNGVKQRPDSNGVYIIPLRTFESPRLKPDVEEHIDWIDDLERQPGSVRSHYLVRVLPFAGGLYQPEASTAPRRRVALPKTTLLKTTTIKEVSPALGLAGRVAGVQISDGAELQEVIIVGYGQVRKSNLTAAVINVDHDSDYSVRHYEQSLNYRETFYRSLPSALALQPKAAYDETIRFTYADPAASPPDLLLWNPGLRPENNHYALTYKAPRLSATYRIILEGITDGGAPVHLEETISTTAPWTFTAALPERAVAGDTITLTGVLTNRTGKTQTHQHTLAFGPGLQPLQAHDAVTRLPADSSVTLTRTVVVTGNRGETYLDWATVPDGRKNDVVSRRAKFTLHPRLFTHRSDAATAGGQELAVTFDPEEYVGKVRAEIVLYSSAIDQIIRSYAGMLREPHGCFEQVTSTSYPNALIVDLLRERPTQEYAARLRLARKYLASGYRQLSRYEQPGGGFGLWQNATAKPRYSAMALLQFADLAKVWQGVDPGMIRRTRRWLRDTVEQRGFVAGPGQLYQLLALVRSGETGLDALIGRHAEQVASKPQEHYYALLLARVYLAQGNVDGARAQVRGLVPVVRSRSLNLQSESAGIGSAYGRFSGVEMLGYFIESYLETEGYDGFAEMAFGWATELKSSRSYQPTQAKIRYLRALRALAIHRKPPVDNALVVLVNGVPADTLSFATGVGQTLHLDLTDYVRPGPNDVRLRFGEAEHYPALVWSAVWQRELPPRPDVTPLTLSWRADSTARRGELVGYRLALRNVTDKTVANPMLQIGLPGNAELLLKDLDPLVERGVIDYYELDGAYLNLYLGELAARATREIPLDLTARLAGAFRAPPTAVYPYYQPHLRYWKEGLQLRVE